MPVNSSLSCSCQFIQSTLGASIEIVLQTDVVSLFAETISFAVHHLLGPNGLGFLSPPVNIKVSGREGGRLGHEWMGMVEDVGSMISTIKPGDRVIAPFAFSDGTCEFCHKGLYTNCLHGGFWGQDHDGGQAEAIRAPFADGTLVVVPPSVDQDEALLKAILPLTDVMGTGHYAAVSSDVHAGGTVAIVGDGAVGLCGVLAARRLGAERIILLGHQGNRLELARRFGATDP